MEVQDINIYFYRIKGYLVFAFLMDTVILRRFAVLLLPYLLLLVITGSNALFYDTTQFAGEVPNWYYFNEFRYLLLPDTCDSGHPPGFGLYLALMWKMLGRTLWVSHWAMLPFICLNVYQTVRMGKLLFPGEHRYAWGLAILLLAQTPLLAQSTLVSPDIIVYGAAIWMLNSIWKKEQGFLMLAVLLVAVISIRGMSVAICMFLIKWWYDFRIQDPVKAKKSVFRTGWKALLPFLPGGIAGLLYLVYHYLSKGWITPTPDTPWGYAFEPVSGMQLLKHQVVLLWRILDVGNILSVISAVILIGCFRFKKDWFALEAYRDARFRSILGLVLLLFIFTAWPMTLYRGLLTQRYLLFLTTMIITAGYYLLARSVMPDGRKQALWAVMLLVQLSGSYWMYPATLSQSWDCTLSHLPYYELRKDFLHYMDSEGIDRSKIVTEFPMQKPGVVVDYAADTLSYTPLNETDMETVQWLWYSNVCNGLLKKKAYFDTHFTPVKYEKRGRVEMILYKRNVPVQTIP